MRLISTTRRMKRYRPKLSVAHGKFHRMEHQLGVIGVTNGTAPLSSVIAVAHPMVTLRPNPVREDGFVKSSLAASTCFPTSLLKWSWAGG